MSNRIFIVIVLLVASFLRFYNLLHDSPYFFNPDERNMTIAVSQFRLPNKLSEIPVCLISQISPIGTNQRPKTSDQRPDSCNLNPHFFAYGQFPLYLAFVSDQITNYLNNLTFHLPTTNDQRLTTTTYLSTSHSSAIFWLRFWSALSSTFTILFVYLITKELLRKYWQFEICNLKFAYFAAIMAAFSPGLIQSAHFGTTESLLTFFFISSIYFSLRLFNSAANNFKKYLILNTKYLLLLSLTVGLAIGTKFTGIIFLAPPLIALFIKIIRALKGRKKNKVIILLLHCFIVVLLIIGTITFSVISSPFNLIDLPGFKGTVFGYEADVATGRYEAFYTRQFVDTTPILFQMEKIFPYALGWPVFVLGLVGMFILIGKLFYQILSYSLRRIMNYVSRIKNNKKSNNIIIHDSCFLILASFLIYFLPNAFLFAKWTRFMTPVFPFFAVFAGYFLYELYLTTTKLSNFQFSFASRRTKFQIIKLGYWVIGLLVFICSIMPGTAFMSIYAHEDVRVTASRWIWNNIPDKSYILFETANVIDIPLGIPGEKLPEKNFPTVSFDYYHIDDNKELFDQLLSYLEKADYIFIPSRRIFANYLRLPKRYPRITKYYQLLYSGALGFEKTAEFSSFPQLPISQIGPISLISNDENAEESFTVFDHPVIRIYKKIKSLNSSDYQNLFQL